MIQRGDPRGTPLLFVHGAFHGAWCWDEHFLDFFAERNYHAVALDLRNHPGDPAGATVADYVADVRAAADALSRPPVVIGHSMGGFVVQKYLADHPAPAGVLLASAPPYGLRKAALRVAYRNARHSGRPVGAAQAVAVLRDTGSGAQYLLQRGHPGAPGPPLHRIVVR
jgi:pimeloyl-ACP methyl ester carboxylesterase